MHGRGYSGAELTLVAVRIFAFFCVHKCHCSEEWGHHSQGNNVQTASRVQVLTSVAQAADIMAPLQRAKPLHVVADSRGPLLHEFVERLHVLRAATSDLQHERVLLTTDILPTEDLTAGMPLASRFQEFFFSPSCLTLVNIP